MKSTFKFIRDNRKAFIELIDGLSLDELNQIPEGFNNNIIWNFGHIVVSTQLLCYVRTGIKADNSWIAHVAAYAKGTKPSYYVTQQEVDELKALAISSIDQLENDANNGLFNTIEPFSTHTFHAELSSFEEVLATTAGHDALHFGYAQAERRLVKK